MYIVSANKYFDDIDTFGCAVAYAELLRKEGKEAQAVFVGVLNHTVTKLAYEQNAHYLMAYTPMQEDRFIYVDLSNPVHFGFSPEDITKIVEIYDHHYGFEDYWKDRLGEGSHIERVGAAATLIWEEFKKRGFAADISGSSANLLALAILQNTLNFTSSETTERDQKAFEELAFHVTMEKGWQERYFEECAKGIREHFEETLKNDTKIIEHFFEDQTFLFSQLEITEDPISFFHRHKDRIDAFWSSFQNNHCLINIADMSSKSSLLYANDSAWLHKTVQPLFSQVWQIDAMWIHIPIHQRKQILAMLQNNKCQNPQSI